MANHDYVIANQNGANTRSDLNNALSAIVSNNSSATEPSTTYAFQWWCDTANDILKQRNAADSAWINILTLSTGAPSVSTGIDNLVEDTTPQLGGDLDFQSHKATSFTSTGIDDNATSTAITIDASENVGIGTTPQGTPYSTSKQMFIGATGVVQTFDTSDYESIYLAENTRWDVSGTEHSIISGEASNIRLYRGKMDFKVHGSVSADTAQSSWTTPMTITNAGRVEIGVTSPVLRPLEVTGIADADDSVAVIDAISWTAGTAYHMRWRINGSTKGSVTSNGTSISYNTTSDYRLKENVVPMTGSIDRLKALKPSKFNFIADADTTVDGFLAHEAQAVVPECATGTKDAMMDEEYEVTPAVMDDDGNVVTEAVMGTRSVPDYQGIDQSKLVPLLTSALQEAVAKIESLEARVTALEL